MSCRRRWEDLLPEILSLILSNLHGKDVTIFRSVCRNWNSVPQPKSKQIHHFSEIVKYPFLLTYRDKSSSSILYTPAYNKTYPIGAPFSGSVQIHSSNHGWLLLSRRDRRVFFFLQPVTGDIVTLPRLNLKLPNLNEMSFSAPPTSRHCVVFGIQGTDCSSPSTRFAFIRRGDSEWRFSYDFYLNITRLKFRARGLVGSKVKKNRCTIRPVTCYTRIRWASSCSAPVFHKGAFYCLSQDRKLGVFDPRKAAWRLLDTTSNRYIRRSSSSKVYLMESSRGGGELISVVVGLRGEFVRMYRFDDDSRQWQGLRSLGDQVAFLSPTSSIILQCKQLQVKGLENTIHFPSFDENCNVFYSLSTGRFHSFEGGYIPDDTSYKQLQLNSTWMMPEFRGYSDQQLDWNNNDLPEEEEEDGTEFDPSICSTSIDDNYIIDTSTTTTTHSTSTTTRGTPWIVLSHEQNTTLVDLVTNIAHSNDSRIEMFRGKKIYGSSNDGLVLLVDSESGGDCVLLNTNSMTVEPLPTLKFPKKFSRYCSVIQSTSCETVVTIFGGTVSDRGVTSTTIFCRVGDEEWTKNTGGVQVHEASAYQGKIYGRGVIPGTRFFVELELKQRHYYKVRTIRGFELPHNKYMGRIFDLGINVVESGGELLFIEMVFSDIIEDGYLPVVSDVRVSRVDMEGKRTELVKDLGDRAFFVSNGGGVGFGCCASELGLERNSIYFIAKYCGNVYKYDYGSHRISKVFSARDHGFEIEELVMFY